MKKWIMSLALCLLIPVGAMAVTEGVVEAADQVEMGQIPVSELSFLPDSNYFPRWMKVTQLLEYFSDFYEDFQKEKARPFQK